MIEIFKLQNVFNLILLVYLFYLLIEGSIVKFIRLFSITILIAPLWNLGVSKIPFSYTAVLILAIYLLFNFNELRINKLLLLFFCMSSFPFLLELISTLTSLMLKLQTREVSLPYLGGTFRNIFLSFALLSISYTFSKNIKMSLLEMFLPVFETIMILNFCALMIQLLKPTFGFFLVDSLYTSQSQNTISGEFILSRGYGLNYSPVLLGIKSLLSFSSTLFGIEYLSKNKFKRAIFLILLSSINGILSLSKTFIIGSLVFLALFVLLLIFKCNRKKTEKSNYLDFTFNLRNVKLIAVILAILLIFNFSMDTLQKLTNLPFSFYFRRIFYEPQLIYGSRYMRGYLPEDTLLTYKVISQNLLLGVGFTSIEGEFIGDSEYILTLHNSGLLGLLLKILSIVFLLFISFKYKSRFLLSLILVIILVSFAVPVINSEIFLSIICISIGVLIGKLRKEESDAWN